MRPCIYRLHPYTLASLYWNWMEDGQYNRRTFRSALCHATTLCWVILARKHIIGDASCELCHGVPETATHIFLECPFAKSFWAAVGVLVGVSDIRDLHQLNCPPHIPQTQFSAFLLLCCWRVWKRRNDMIFDRETRPLSYVLQECKVDARLWAHRLGRGGRELGESWCMIFSRQP